MCRREVQCRQQRHAARGKALLVQPAVACAHIQVIHARDRAHRQRRAQVQSLFAPADQDIHIGYLRKLGQRVGNRHAHRVEHLLGERPHARRQINRRHAAGDLQQPFPAHRAQIGPGRAVFSCFRAGQQRIQRRLRAALSSLHRHAARHGDEPSAILAEKIQRAAHRIALFAVLRRCRHVRFDLRGGQIGQLALAHLAHASAQQQQERRQSGRQRRAPHMLHRHPSFPGRLPSVADHEGAQRPDIHRPVVLHAAQRHRFAHDLRVAAVPRADLGIEHQRRGLPVKGHRARRYAVCQQ